VGDNIKKYKVGVIGCGLISKLRHIPAYKKLNDFEVHAVCDLNEDLAKATAKEFKIKKDYIHRNSFCFFGARLRFTTSLSPRFSFACTRCHGSFKS